MSQNGPTGSVRTTRAPIIHKDLPMPSTTWRFVPMADYVVPSSDPANRIKKRWKSLRQLLSSADKGADTARAEAELRALPNVRLAHLVPPIDWSGTAGEFADAHKEVPVNDAERPTLDPSGSAGEESALRFLVCQPYCDHTAILRNWAARQGAEELTPPEPAQILAGDQSWLETLPRRGGQAWALPGLERCFLRHANGLDLVRRFLERALGGELGAGVIACDSWAYAFIQRIWPLPGTPALTLQALDGPALADYFLTPRPASDGLSQTRFHSARSGEPLRADETLAQANGNRSENTRKQSLPEFRLLAARCRGNPGLAWHYWRKQLRSEPDQDQKDRCDDDEDSCPARERAGQIANDIVWVAQDLVTPALPIEADEDVAFVLHALLLHRGLTTDLLALQLPVARTRIASQLLRLQALGLLVRHDAWWHVAPLAYSTVREYLDTRGYLIDAF